MAELSLAKGLETFRNLKGLTQIGRDEHNNPMLPAEFWKRYDAGEFKR
jgi:hypothetical protein